MEGNRNRKERRRRQRKEKRKVGWVTNKHEEKEERNGTESEHIQIREEVSDEEETYIRVGKKGKGGTI